MAGVPMMHGTVQTSDQQKDHPLVVSELHTAAGSVASPWTLQSALGQISTVSQSRDGSRSHRSLKQLLQQEINFSSWLLQP